MMRNLTAHIRKDDWLPSRPWHADLSFDDEDGSHRWRSWQQFWMTKRALVKAVRASEPDITIIDCNGRHIK